MASNRIYQRKNRRGLKRDERVAWSNHKFRCLLCVWIDEGEFEEWERKRGRGEERRRRYE